QVLAERALHSQAACDVHRAADAVLLQHLRRGYVDRFLEGLLVGDGAPELAIVVVGLPRLAIATGGELDRRIVDDAGRGLAGFERGQIDERLERGAGLTPGLDGAVELALEEIVPTNHLLHVPG